MAIKEYAVVLLIFIFSCAKTKAPAPSFSCSSYTNTGHIHGVNWADKRDNFVDGWLLPSGITAGDDYNSIQIKSGIVISGFRNNIGANTIRLPINPQTVLDTWWQNYSGIIDKSLNSDMNVILAYWEGNVHKDGFIDDSTQFWNMWQVVVSKYKNNDNVYFEVMNEPFGYPIDGWKAVCRQWLSTFSYIPRCRVLIGGPGYDDYVAFIGSDSAFEGCLLSQHLYPWWGNYATAGQWSAALQSRIGGYESRTIVTEFGAPMTTGLNYSQLANGDVNVAFIQGMAGQLKASGCGSCYWPGLRDDDFYSMQLLRNDSMINSNPSGIQQLRKGWRLQ